LIFHEENKILFRNFSALTVLQIGNYLFPLVTFPYLVRVLGPAKYGLVNFAAAFAAYFTIIVNYGFHLSATREISVIRDDAEKLARKFWTVIFTKFLLLLLSVPLFAILIFSFEKFSSNVSVYTLSFLAVFGAALFPDWFFQGIEKMKAIAVINLSVKALWVVAIFLFVKSADDILLLIFLNGVSLSVIGLIGLLYAKFSFALKFVLPSSKEIFNQLKSGYHVFLSTISISLYTTSNVFILGLIAGDVAVGYFTAADKIRIAVQGIFSNAGQTIYPRVAKLFRESRQKAIGFLRKYLKILLAILLPLTLVLLLGAEFVVKVLLGLQYLESVAVLKILIFLPLLIALSNVYGIQIMLNTGYKKEFTKIVFTAGALDIIFALILTPYFSEIGTAVAVLFAEFYVTFAMWRFVKGKGIM
jgi:PST family polysaccharide transporter